jgi:HK97 family phage major capsid protein
VSTTRTDQAPSWLPQDYGDLLNTVVQAKSIAAQVSKIFPTDKQKVGFPKWVSDPAVGFYDELDEITPADGDTDEVVVVPSKTAGLTLLSNEVIDDSDPDIADETANGLANQIAQSLDSAYFGDTVAKGPDGLLSTSYTVVAAGSAVTNLDAFVDARFAAEAHSAKLSHWVMHPDTAKLLSKLKTDSSASNLSLLQFVADGITVAGLPVLTSTHVDEGTVAWGIDHTQQRYVLRKGTAVERFDSVTNDGKWIRAISRNGFGFLNEPGLVRIVLSPLSYTLTVTGGSGGSDHYTLKVNGVETASIAYNANAAAIKSAIVAVDDGVAADDVTVTGSGPFTVSLPATLSHGTDAGATTTTVAVA